MKPIALSCDIVTFDCNIYSTTSVMFFTKRKEEVMDSRIDRNDYATSNDCSLFGG